MWQHPMFNDPPENRIPQSLDPAGGPEHTRPRGRGGGGVALSQRPRPGSRLRLPPRKAGAAASFRFLLAPTLGPPVRCGKQRLLRERRTLLRAQPPPDSSLGSRAASSALGRETPNSPPAPRPRRALSPLPRPGSARAADRWPARKSAHPSPGLPSLPSRACRHKRQFFSFPGSRDRPHTFLFLSSFHI